MIFMKTQSNFYLFLIALISAMGGFLFGYDWVVIGGAKPFYEQYFGIANDPVMQGWAMSSALIGLRPKRSLSLPALSAPNKQPIKALLIAHPCMTGSFAIPKYCS